MRLRNGALRSSVAIATHPTRARGQFLNLFPLDTLNRSHKHLGDAHRARYAEWLRPLIDEEDLDLSTVIGINRPWRVQNGNAVLQRQAGTGTYLRFEPYRYGHGKATGDCCDAPRENRDVLLYCCAQVHGGRPVCLVRR